MGLNYYDNIEYFINDSAKDWKKGLLSKAQSISIEHCKGNHVLDVGGGRGELALSLANKKNVQMIEPSVKVMEMLRQTRNKFKIPDRAYKNFKLLNSTFYEAWWTVNKIFLDTVIFCDSLPHIKPNTWRIVYPEIKKIFADNGGRLIITNSNYPIRAERGVYNFLNGNFFDKLELDGTVIYRENGFFIMDYGK